MSPRRLGFLLAAVWVAACETQVQPTTLAVRYHTGDQVSYRYHQVFTGILTGSGGVLTPITFDLRAQQSMRVTAVDAGGTATLEVDLLDATGTSNGQPLPALGTQRYQVQMAPDGRIVSGGASAGSSRTLSLPGADQEFAILTARKVKPGDTWQGDYDRPNPLGSGSIKVHSDSRFLRYEGPQGSQIAVVESKLSTPVGVDVTVAGQAVHESGTVTADVTSRVDPREGTVVKSSASSKFQLSAAGEQLTGDQTIDLEIQT